MIYGNGLGWVGVQHVVGWVGFQKVDPMSMSVPTMLARVLPGLTRIWNTQVAGIDEASQ